MDPVTHGVVGSLAAASLSGDVSKKKVGLIGFGAAILPDAEALIILPGDPLFNLEIHRQFTHSLVFIPAGVLIAAAVFWLIFRSKLSPRTIFLSALAGYATHGIIDLFTSYGTELLWPFMDHRFALNIISVVDPVVTSGLICFAAAFFWFGRNWSLPVAWGWFAFFLVLGAVQNHRAEQAMMHLAGERGHEIERYVVKPTIGNQLVWRTTYVSEGYIHTEGVRTGYVSGLKIYEGESAPKVDMSEEFSSLEGTTLYTDLRRFAELSKNYLVRHPNYPDVIGDARYSMLPTSMIPLWGVKTAPSTPEKHVELIYYRDSGEDVRNAFLDMILGRDLRESEEE